VLFLLCLLPLATPFLCPYAGPTYSIVSTIVHFDGTPSYPSTIQGFLSFISFISFTSFTDF